MKVVYHDGTVAECPKEDALHILRHTAAHIMAQAVKRLYPYAVFAYGPANDKGFYYDVDLGVGPHLCYTKALKTFKLLDVSGAYWKNDSSNKMLTRIRGTAFLSQNELDQYMELLAEAEKRDHRRIGKEMGLFMFSDDAPGFPFFLQKVLTEHFAGKFPVWLAPTQVKVLLVSEKSADYGQEIYTALRNAKIRCELDARNEKIGYLIREAQVIDRVPYMVIIGQKEAEERKISVRSRDTAKTQTMTLADFMEIIHQDIDCALSSP